MQKINYQLKLEQKYDVKYLYADFKKKKWI